MMRVRGLRANLINYCFLASLLLPSLYFMAREGIKIIFRAINSVKREILLPLSRVCSLRQQESRNKVAIRFISKTREIVRGVLPLIKNTQSAAPSFHIPYDFHLEVRQLENRRTPKVRRYGTPCRSPKPRSRVLGRTRAKEVHFNIKSPVKAFHRQFVTFFSRARARAACRNCKFVLFVGTFANVA